MLSNIDDIKKTINEKKLIRWITREEGYPTTSQKLKLISYEEIFEIASHLWNGNDTIEKGLNLFDITKHNKQQESENEY